MTGKPGRPVYLKTADEQLMQAQARLRQEQRAELKEQKQHAAAAAQPCIRHGKLQKPAGSRQSHQEENRLVQRPTCDQPHPDNPLVKPGQGASP